ncbi:MAG: tRNA pseudouridine(55) synthase TruB, partial [Chloroflexi bacterium]|nr:tRNA pseudouridine(55) synthase TruB [Chloroflexota bacterium]
MNKPSGPTSHDIVAWARRLIGQRRIGHAGTLDPAAEGVLVLGLGRATRVIEYAAGARKRYRATIRLGVATTTDDAEGEIVRAVEQCRTNSPDGLFVPAKGPLSPFASLPEREGLERVEAALDTLRGPIWQRPPAFSAVKVQGQRLYAAARRGELVEAPPRQVTVYDLCVLSYDRPEGAAGPDLHLTVECGPGTYIRA